MNLTQIMETPQKQRTTTITEQLTTSKKFDPNTGDITKSIKFQPNKIINFIPQITNLKTKLDEKKPKMIKKELIKKISEVNTNLYY
nr:hypothetical protein ['Fragaria x ananassa' phyllody phytoplasma]